MTEEEDLLESRAGNPFNASSPKMSADRSVSVMSAISARSVKSGASTATIDARLLSHATNQATIAARSILVSSGTEETALKTAKAAAQSVLFAHHDSQISKGPKGMFLKRKIKKQAEVVASMALVSATNAIRNNQWDTLPNAGNDDELRMMQLQLENGDNASAMSSLPPPTPKQNQANSAKSPKSPKTSAQSSSARLVLVDTIHEEDSPRNPKSPVRSFVSNATSDQEIHRPVAIRVETKNNRRGSGYASPKTPSSRRNRDLADEVPDEDPIYALAQTPNTTGRSEDDDDDETRQDRGLDVVSTTSSHGDDNTFATHGTTGTTGSTKSFMQGSVDPIIFSFTNIFRCFEASSNNSEEVAEETDDGRSLVDDGTQVDYADSFATKSRSNLESRQPSSVGEAPTTSREISEDDSHDDDVSHDDDFFAGSYDEHGISQDTSGSSSYEERRPSRKSKLRQKMKKIIGRNNRRQVERDRSESSEDTREQYSSDSKEGIIESGESSMSSGSSSSEEEERHSSRYKKKQAGGRFGWRSRRQRRDAAEE
eukprot:CAMPEP_0119022442 /NCGR_PEP_ID=MMETSP1176-20130426/28048_1 /TAXON_ID=265551 /ORGANISM="Synedropsis recta cf, Strain CCMP1620" /LENGTH=540 /DNA_ID=CAMNT_0006977303 /DNA_START=41 /DNA_END=1660 /DNA_ORIENTATION=+